MELLLLVLTCWRVTRFLVRDEFPLVKTPRDAACHWLDPRDEHGRAVEPSPMGGFGRALAYLAECDWCMSFWVALVLVWLADTTIGLPAPLLAAGAVWAGSCLIAAVEGHIDRRGRLDHARTVEVEANLRRRGQTGV